MRDAQNLQAILRFGGMLRPAVRGSGHGDWLLSHASINGVKNIHLEHKIEVDPTEATVLPKQSCRASSPTIKCARIQFNLVEERKKFENLGANCGISGIGSEAAA